VPNNTLTKNRNPFVVSFTSALVYAVVYFSLEYFWHNEVSILETVLGALVFFVVFYIITVYRNKRVKDHEEERYPENYFIKRGMALGIIFGPALGVLLIYITGKEGLFGLGVSLGVLFGLMFGGAIEKKYEEEGKIEPVSEEKRQKQKRGLIAGITVLIIAILLFLGLLFL